MLPSQLSGGDARRRRLLPRAACVAATLLAWPGCSDPPALNRESYELAKALYAACNYASAEQLERFEALLAKGEASGAVAPAAAAALRAALDEAKNGDWDDAGERVRKLLAAQNRAAAQ